MTLKGEIVTDYLRQWPNVPKQTLAKMIYKENVEVFKDVENVRDLIRSHTGKHGKKKRDSLSNKEFLDQNEYKYDIFQIPESDEDSYPPFHIPTGYKKVAIFSDVHIPYHSVKALKSAITHCKSQNVDAVLLNGDILDFYMASRFNKDPRKRTISGELDMTATVIQIIQQELGCPVYFKKGNHDERLELFLRVKAPELLGIAEFELTNLLAARGARVEVIHRAIVMVGKLPVLHGHEFFGGGTSSVNPARGLFLKANKSCVVGHHHRTSLHSDSDVLGKLITTWSLGCLCGLTPEYAQINKWNHGFAIVNVSDDGAFDLENFRIYQNKVYQ
jgi:predicted phosphodiesterase